MEIKICLVAICIVTVSSVSASFKLVEYDPLVFQLQFSEAVLRPNFQVLFNNMYNIPYTFTNQVQLSSIFTIQASRQNLQVSQNIQTFNLMFNNPLSVANGKLGITSYTLIAQKSRIQTYFPAAIGILIVFASYFVNIFTELGILAIQFLYIFTLYMFQTKMKTTLYESFFTGLLIIPPADVLSYEVIDQDSFIMECLTIPLLIIFVFAFIGFLCKRCVTHEESILKRVVVQEFSFNYFVKASNIFTFNLLFNSIMFIRISNDPQVLISSTTKQIGSFLVYFNLITYFAILYLKVYILNPKINEKDESRQKYIMGKEFKRFQVLHRRVFLNPWYKRNFQIFNSLKIMLIIGVYFGSHIFEYFTILIQFLFIFFIFTVRPFKDEFFLNTKIICRLLFFTEYVFIVLGNLYYDMVQSSLNYRSIHIYVTAKCVSFLVFLLVIYILIFIQIYSKCTNINYQLKLVREANEFKFQLVQKRREQTDGRIRKHKQTSYSSNSKTIKVEGISEVTSSQRNAIKRNSSKGEVDSYGEQSVRRLRNKSKIKYQMMEMMDLKLSTEDNKEYRKKKLSQGNQGSGEKRKLKWQQQSLLEGLAKKT